MHPDTLRLTIVTPVLNRLAMLQEAVESVRRQDVPAFEHIIVDGGSSDGTREWVEAQPDLTFLPPPDRGVYDAMNKGIATAQGDVIGLLNSDDLYEPNCFGLVIRSFAENPGAGIVAGQSRLVEDGTTIARFDQISDLRPDVREILVGRCLPNPRFFLRRSLESVGPIEIKAGLVADRDFLVRLLEAGVSTAILPQLVYTYRRHPGSLTFDSGLKLSLRLRQELMALGRRWRSEPSASREARLAGCELEGRQRLKLATSALRDQAPGAALALLLKDEGHFSMRAPTALLAALRGAFLRKPRPQ